MSSRFKDKFKTTDKISSDIAEDILSAGKLKTKNEYNLVIEKKPKKKSATYYLQQDLIDAIQRVANNNQVSVSEALEHILRQVIPSDKD